MDVHDLTAAAIARAVLVRALAPVDRRSRHNAWASMSEQGVRRRERAEVEAYLAATEARRAGTRHAAASSRRP